MERAERTGFAVALVGHALLFGALSLGLLSTSKPLPPVNEPIDLQLIDAVGLRSAAPVAAREAPAPAKAPDAGPPEEAAPEPTPRPAPPEPAPAPPAPKAIAKPAPPEAVKPAPVPKPVPPKPAATPVKPAPAKIAAAPATPAPEKHKPVAAAAAARPAKPGAGTKARTAGAVASDDFLKGISPEKSPGKAQAPRVQAIGALAMNGLAAAIKRQIQPCYEIGSLGGTPAMRIVTVLNLKFNRDGSVAGTPSLVDQSGIDDGNRGYARQIADVGRRAVLRCAPLKLPPELYEGGWDDLNFRFTPGQMQ